MTPTAQERVRTNLVEFIELYAEANSIDEGASLMNGILIGVRLKELDSEVCRVVTHALEDHLAQASSLPHEMFEQAARAISEKFGR